MFSINPKSAAKRSKRYRLHIFYFKAGRTQTFIIFEAIFAMLVAFFDLWGLCVHMVGAILEVVELQLHLLDQLFFLVNIEALSETVNFLFDLMAVNAIVI